MLTTCLAALTLYAATGFSKPIHDRDLGSPAVTCPTNNYHRVETGETCQFIAANASVSTGDLQALNSLNAQCTDLQANSTICLPGVCTTYVVAPGDTCAKIASTHNNMNLTTFYAINPTINSTDCSNLLSGMNICLTQPAGPALPSSAQNTTSSSNSTDTQPGGATLAPGTAANCTKVYQAQTGDICSGIAAKNNISVAWFEAQNPAIDAGCTKLAAGTLYCVQQEGGGQFVNSAGGGKRWIKGAHVHMLR